MNHCTRTTIPLLVFKRYSVPIDEYSINTMIIMISVFGLMSQMIIHCALNVILVTKPNCIFKNNNNCKKKQLPGVL